MKLKIQLLLSVIMIITTQKSNMLTSENFTATLAQANLSSENDIANFVKKIKMNQINYQKKLKQYKKKTKGFINKFSVLNGAKNFLQKYFKII